MDPRFLITIPGKGYKFVADVENLGSEIMIEKHSFSKIVIEEESEDEKVVEARTTNRNVSAEDGYSDALSSSRSSTSWKKIIAIAAGALGVLLLVLGRELVLSKSLENSCCSCR